MKTTFSDIQIGDIIRISNNGWHAHGRHTTVRADKLIDENIVEEGKEPYDDPEVYWECTTIDGRMERYFTEEEFNVSDVEFFSVDDLVEL